MICRRRHARPPRWWRFTRHYLRDFDDWSDRVFNALPLWGWILVGAALIQVENWILAAWSAK